MSRVVIRDLEKFRILTKITILAFFRNSNFFQGFTKVMMDAESTVMFLLLLVFAISINFTINKFGSIFSFFMVNHGCDNYCHISSDVS